MATLLYAAWDCESGEMTIRNEASTSLTSCSH